MLQSMRELAHSWVVKGLMLFLIVSFSIWGIGDIFRGNPLQRTVAKVGDMSISVQSLNHAFESSLAVARQKINPNFSAADAKKMGVLDETLQGEIKRSLIDQDIKRLNINVPQESVLQMLGQQPQFRDKDGAFNKDLFRQYLSQQNVTETGFMAKAQDDLAREILLNALNTSRNMPQTIIDALYRARAQKRVLDVVTLDTSKIGGISAPDDKALHDFYNDNAQLFTAPEYRTFTIATLSLDDMAKDIKISDDQVKAEYDEKGDQLATPEQRDLVQVVVQDEAKAKQLATQAKATGDLSAAAAAAKESAIPLDKAEESSLLPELGKAVFVLKTGQISDPVKTQLGWHIVQVKHITPAGKPTFEQIKNKLRDDMQHDQAVDASARIVNQLDDQLAAGHSLDDIADELKLRLVKLPSVDATGTTEDGTEPKEFPYKENALKDAFAQNAGETSPVEDDKLGNYYVVRTDEITPAAAKPFDQIKPKIVKAWTMRQQQIQAEAIAEKINKGLRDGKPLASFEGQEGVSTRISAPLSKIGDTDALLPADIITRALNLKKGETALSVANGKIVIARVASISDADFAKQDPRKNMIGLEIKQHAGEELLDQYLDHLHNVFPVKIDNALLDQMRQQDN